MSQKQAHADKNKATTLIFLSIIAVLAYLISLILNVFLSHHMTAEDYGIFSVAFGLLAVLSSIALLGTGSAASRFIPYVYDAIKHSQLSSYLHWNLQILSISFGLSFSLAFMFLLVGLVAHLLGIYQFHEYNLITMSLWCVPVAGASILLSKYLIALSYSVIGCFFQSLFPISIILLYLYIANTLFDIQLQPHFIILSSWIVAFTLSIFIQLLYMRVHIKDFYQTLFLGKYEKSTVINKEWLKTSLHYISTNIFTLLLWYLDLFILTVLATDRADIGYYSALIIISRALYMFPMTLTSYVWPKISSHVKNLENKHVLQREINRTNLIIFITVSSLLMCIIVNGEWILSLFGQDFTKVFSPLYVMCLGIYCSSMTRVAKGMLLYAGFEAINSYILLTEIIILLITGIPATFYFELWGITIVTSTLMILTSLAYIVLAKKYVPEIKPLSII